MIFTDLQHVEHIVNVKHVLHIVFYDQENRVTFHFENKFLSCHVDAQTLKKIKNYYANALDVEIEKRVEKIGEILKANEAYTNKVLSNINLSPIPKIREN